jgi:signal transduction histidine kinase
LKKYKDDCQPLVCNDLRFDPIFVALDEPSVQNVMAAPWQDAESMMGILCLFDKQAGSVFSEADNRFAMISATQAARFLKSAREAVITQRFNEELLNQRYQMMAFLLSETHQNLNQPLTGFKQSISQLSEAFSVFLDRLDNEYQKDFRQKTDYIVPTETITAELDKLNSNNLKLKKILDKLEKLKTISKADKSALNLNMLVKSILSSFRRKISDRIDIRTGLTDIPEIEADPDQIKLAVTNVLLNAVDAIGTKGRLEIDTFEENNQVKIRVTDDGHGISEDLIKKVFEPGFTTRTDRTGSGYGLTIAHQIINNHKGRLQIKSQPGRGTSVEISFPAQQLFSYET